MSAYGTKQAFEIPDFQGCESEPEDTQKGGDMLISLWG